MPSVPVVAVHHPTTIWILIHCSEQCRQKATLPGFRTNLSVRIVRAIILHYELADETSIIRGDVRSTPSRSFFSSKMASDFSSLLSRSRKLFRDPVAFVRSSSVIEARLDRSSSAGHSDIKPKIASSCFWRKIIRSWFNASATSCCRSFLHGSVFSPRVCPAVANSFHSNKFSKMWSHR